MSFKRKIKKRKREERNLRQQRVKEQDARRVISSAGLDDVFAALPSDLQLILLRMRLPQPELVIAPSAQDFDRIDQVSIAYEFALHTRFPLYDSGELSFADVWRVLASARATVSWLVTNCHRTSFSDKERVRLESFLERVDAFLNRDGNLVQARYVLQFWSALIGLSKLDEVALWYEHLRADPNVTKKPFGIVVHAERPEMREFEIAGSVRTAFRCCLSSFVGALTQVTLSATELGLRQGTPDLPLFIQKHALIQLQERVYFQNPESFFETFESPELTPRADGTWLITYRYGGLKLGYFVCIPLLEAGCAVVRTFLLATMQGTPEADLLRTRLKLRRPDIEYLQLDDVRTFFETDLYRDPEIVAVLEECGLDHLLLLRAEFNEKCKVGFAAMFKKFIGESKFSAASSFRRVDLEDLAARSEGLV